MSWFKLGVDVIRGMGGVTKPLRAYVEPIRVCFYGPLVFVRVRFLWELAFCLLDFGRLFLRMGVLMKVFLVFYYVSFLKGFSCVISIFRAWTSFGVSF